MPMKSEMIVMAHIVVVTRLTIFKLDFPNILRTGLLSRLSPFEQSPLGVNVR